VRKAEGFDREAAVKGGEADFGDGPPIGLALRARGCTTDEAARRHRYHDDVAARRAAP
jgi:hypothetical protein